jgi:hypothetical protein
VNAVVRLLWVICAVLVADAFAADPDASKSERQSPSQPSGMAPPGAVAQSPAVAPTDPSTIRAATPDASSTSKSGTAAQPPVADKSGKTVLVDDTVTGAQLRQILAKGYRPVGQAPGNEVSYCRREQLAGQRFQTKVCKTARRILEDEQRGKDLTDSVDRIGLQTGGR